MPNIFLRIIREILILSLACGAAAAQAERLPAERYPWDMRPLKCNFEEGVESFFCKANDWPDFAVTKDRLRMLGQQGQFALLERALRELATSEELFPGGVNKAAAVYGTLDEFVDAHRSIKLEESPLTKWRAAFPHSDFILLADALALHAKAWDARGEGVASTVSPESWEIFAKSLGEAEQKLMSAPPSLKDTAVWHLILLTVALEGRGVKSDPRTVFLNAVKRWPRYLSFYRLIASRLVPKWGGSWEAVEAFIDHSSRQLESTEGMSFYARLYAALGDAVVKERTAMNWTRMKRGFDDWIARDPNAVLKNLYASYACFARDKSTFGKAMSLIPKQELSLDSWLDGYSYEACFRWVGI